MDDERDQAQREKGRKGSKGDGGSKEEQEEREGGREGGRCPVVESQHTRQPLSLWVNGFSFSASNLFHPICVEEKFSCKEISGDIG